MEHTSLLVQLLVTGVFLSSLYVLGAYGLTLVYGVMGIINFAHGAFAVLAAYIFLIAIEQLGINFFIALIFVILLMIIAGYITFETFTRFTFNLGDVHVIVYYALFLVISNLLAITFGVNTHIINSDISYRNIHLGKLEFNLLNLFIIILSLAFSGAMHLFLKYSMTGKKIRAISQNEEAAKILGVNPMPLRRLAWILGVVSAGLFGVLIGLTNPFTPYSGSSYLIIAFSVSIVGGMGNVLGTIVAGFIIGMTESLSTFILPSELSPIVIFVIVIITLVVRPMGLLSKNG